MEMEEKNANRKKLDDEKNDNEWVDWNDTHLFGDGAPSEIFSPIALVRLTEEGIERLVCPHCGGRVGRDGEGGDIGHLLKVILNRGGPIENVRVLKVLREALQHGKGFAEVHLEEENGATYSTIKRIFQTG